MMDDEVRGSAAWGETSAAGAAPIVSLTDTAVARVKEVLRREGRPEGSGLRVSVVGGGCSGFQYSLGFADAAGDEDTVYEFGDVKVFVDAMSAQYLEGTVIDYVNGLHGAGFKFLNPKAERTCGCGSSFAV
jgi:iron-sulfur cluster assembly accessory protein